MARNHELVKANWFTVCFDQLKLLLWKNYKLQIRSIIITILEILVPGLFAVILLPIRSIVSSDNYLNNTVYEPFEINTIPFRPVAFDPKSRWSFAYTPNNSVMIEKIMQRVGTELNFDLISFEDEESLENNLVLASNTKNFLGGAVFLNQTLESFTYKLRFSYSPKNSGEIGSIKRDQDWKTNFIFFLFPILGPREKKENDGGDPGYVREGFAQVQKAIDFALIQQQNTQNTTLTDITLNFQRFAFPPYNDDKFVAIIAAFLPFIIILSFVFTVILTAKAIVYEKETGLKEAMKLMGMKPWVYWLSWYIKTFILLLPALFFMIIAYKIPITLKDGSKASIIDKTDPYLFALFLFIFTSSSITFTFLCTTFFKKANSAAAGAGVIWFFSYLPFIFISLRYEKMTVVDRLLACFVNNLGMAEGMFMIGQYEGKGTGLNFANWDTGFQVNDSFTFQKILIIMLFNNIIHLVLTYYFECVIPSGFGTTKPWYFPISWLLPKQLNLIDTKNSATSSGEKFLEDEKSLAMTKNVGIKISRIGKMFKQAGIVKTAVKNLSLNIYEGQISVLLGHNGAGKSTTISMVTGLTAPDRGEISICGHNINTETDQARSVLGYCPQHNLLFNDLTVQEHLEFFARLKRYYDQTEIDDMLKLINLYDKKFAMSKTLSGGMKRKLSVAIAFIGGSKIVILDEPSSGMDPQARHSTWSLLQKFRKERDCTILLTTHFMDEADFLGDRIAIMSQGELQCCGSPLYLKSKYGSGYNLVITRNNKRQQQLYGSSDINPEVESMNAADEKIVSRIDGLVTRLVPDSKMLSNVNSELSFVLPTVESKRFPSLFTELDRLKDELGILNVGVSITTLEEVFLKINESEDVASEPENPTTSYSNSNGEFKNDEQSKDLHNKTINLNQKDEHDIDFGLWAGSKPEDLVGTYVLYAQQFYALIVKRLINSLRNKGLVSSQIIIPIAILLVNLFYVKFAPIKAEDSPPLTMKLASYGKTYIPIELLPGSKGLANDLMNAYVAQFNSNPDVTLIDLANKSKSLICFDKRSNMNDFMGCVGSTNFYSYIDQYIVASTYEETSDTQVNVTAFFNNQPFHVVPLSINLMTNSFLRYFSKSSNASITVINHPLPRNFKEQADDLTTKNQTGFQVGSGLTFGFSFLIASFAIFLIRERVSDAKHLQYMSGCNSNVFWFAAFVWDIINYLIPSIVVVLLLFAFQIDAYTTNWRWALSLLLLVFYGMAHIPQIYLFSYIFKVSSTGFAALTAFNILTSQATLLPVAILSLPQLGLVDTAVFLEWLFIIIFPNFSIGQAFIDLYSNDAIKAICQPTEPICGFVPNLCCNNFNTSNPFRCGKNGPEDCLKWTTSVLDWEKPGVGRFLFFMPAQFLVLFTIVLFYEAGWFRQFAYNLKQLVTHKSNKNVEEDKHILIGSNSIVDIDEEEAFQDIPKDIDVTNEEKRIKDMLELGHLYSETFVLDQLKKYYGKFMAVKGISFTLKQSECFGLLGVNGAGKTSTFKMITGDEFITDGEAYLGQTSLKNNIKSFQRQLGYCPQFDPLIDQMTVLETMKMYGRLRGLRPKLLDRACDSLIKLLDLSDHTYKMCYTLSGGNKRKLSVAISLIGSPTVVLLDEPTSGMDPKTRRILWNTINNIRIKGKSLILTTHGMEETEALCTNIGIMVNGELKCMGTLQHLKSKYGEGYTLLAKIPMLENNQEKIDKFVNLILNSFASELRESRDGFINIQIKNSKTSELGNIFELVEKSKEEFSIEYYVVTQTKLEQIFLNFASKQVDPETRILTSKGPCGCF